MSRDLVVFTDQLAALRCVEQMIDTELWRLDKRVRWTRMLRRLVCCMDWTTGLVCGVTLAQLAAVGSCSPRTVSRLLAWAQEVGVLVVVEVGAAATFLGTASNRAPAYVFVAPRSAPAEEPVIPDSQSNARPEATDLTQVRGPVDEIGDLPQSHLGTKPSTARKRLDHHSHDQPDWPAWQVPTTPTERSAAVTALLARIGLDGPTVPLWRVRALLCQWWRADACVAGLLYAIDHHPDGTPRGNALRGAADPVRVLGHRLRPWVGRLHELPPELAGLHGDYRAEQAARVAERTAAAERNHVQRTEQPEPPLSTPTVRKAARAALDAHLAERARLRVTPDVVTVATDRTRARSRW